MNTDEKRKQRWTRGEGNDKQKHRFFLCALSALCVGLGSKAACLPASRDGGDDASQRIEVARVNDFAWRMRITQRPGDGHVDGSVAEKRGAVAWPLRYSHSPGEVIDTRDL